MYIWNRLGLRRKPRLFRKNRVTEVVSWKMHVNSESTFLAEPSERESFARQFYTSMATRLQFENSNEIGCFAALTNSYCIVAQVILF